MTSAQVSGKQRPLLTSLLLVALGIALNIALNRLAAVIGIPL